MKYFYQVIEGELDIMQSCVQPKENELWIECTEDEFQAYRVQLMRELNQR